MTLELEPGWTSGADIGDSESPDPRRPEALDGAMMADVRLRRVLILSTVLAVRVQPASADAVGNSWKPRTGLNGVWSDDEGNAWAVGDRGVIVRTSDGGKSWSTLDGPGKTRLNAVWGAPGGRLFVVGDGLLAARSDDDGRTWRRLPLVFHCPAPEVPVAQLELRAIWGTGREVFIVGGTRGGGQSLLVRALLDATRLRAELAPLDDPAAIWGRARDSKPPELFMSGVVFDCHSGDYEALRRSQDGGRVWSKPTDPPRALVTTTAGGTFYALDGRGHLWHTDAGWKALRKRLPLRTSLRTGWRALWAGDKGEIYVVGDGWRIAHSRDGGATFDHQVVAGLRR